MAANLNYKIKYIKQNNLFDSWSNFRNNLSELIVNTKMGEIFFLGS